MLTSVALLVGGRLRQIRFAVSCWLRKIFSRKRAEKSRSYLDGVLRQNSGGFLVRDDRLPPTNSVPTVAARQPA